MIKNKKNKISREDRRKLCVVTQHNFLFIPFYDLGVKILENVIAMI